MTEQRWQQIYEQMTGMGAVEKGDYSAQRIRPEFAWFGSRDAPAVI